MTDAATKVDAASATSAPSKKNLLGFPVYGDALLQYLEDVRRTFLESPTCGKVSSQISSTDCFLTLQTIAEDVLFTQVHREGSMSGILTDLLAYNPDIGQPTGESFSIELDMLLWAGDDSRARTPTEIVSSVVVTTACKLLRKSGDSIAWEDRRRCRLAEVDSEYRKQHSCPSRTTTQ